MTTITVGVLALQGAFHEHIKLLEKAISSLSSSTTNTDPPPKSILDTSSPASSTSTTEPNSSSSNTDHSPNTSSSTSSTNPPTPTSSHVTWQILEVRTPAHLSQCTCLILPGGESTTVSLVASRSGLLAPLRHFVRVQRKPVWGTCAGLILLSEEANEVSAKRGGQELVGGLGVRVNRNFFGRQVESFEDDLQLGFLDEEGTGGGEDGDGAFRGVFIRAPVVKKILKAEEGVREGVVEAPGMDGGERGKKGDVEVLARLPGRKRRFEEKLGEALGVEEEVGDIIAVRQGNVFGTSFHPELTDDARIHVWWLRQVMESIQNDKTSHGSEG